MGNADQNFSRGVIIFLCFYSKSSYSSDNPP